MMHCKIYHAPERKTLTIPRAALQMAGLEKTEALDLRIGDGFLLTSDTALTTEEKLAMYEDLDQLQTALLSRLARASREVLKQYDDACDGCGEDCAAQAPACLLEEAGIDPDGALCWASRKGEVVITAADGENGEEDDPLEGLEQGLLESLADRGVNLEGLRRLIRKERDGRG
mgnify:CR=1 FL=1